jgi:hypothetical protein
MKLPSWLTKDNGWMNNPNVLAQFGHAGIPYGALLTLDHYHRNLVFLILSIGIIVFAGIKEFYYDARYEVPKQSFTNNLTDFAFYCLGVGLAIVIHTV